jgi:hypothetical protein
LFQVNASVLPKDVLSCNFIMEKNYTYSLLANHIHAVNAAISIPA